MKERFPSSPPTVVPELESKAKCQAQEPLIITVTPHYFYVFKYAGVNKGRYY